MLTLCDRRESQGSKTSQPAPQQRKQSTDHNERYLQLAKKKKKGGQAQFHFKTFFTIHVTYAILFCTTQLKK